MADAETFQYWHEKSYVNFSSDAQDQLRRASTDPPLIHVPGLGHGPVVVHGMDQVHVSDAYFSSGNFEHHVRVRPPKKGADETLYFMYKSLKNLDTDSTDARRGWRRISDEETQEELRRCYVQTPHPQRFNFQMSGTSYAMSDFHKVDNCKAYFQALDAFGRCHKGRQIKMNEEGLVQRKLCYLAYEGKRREALLDVLENGADINQAAEVGGLTALGYAVVGNHLGTVEDLVSLRAEVNLVFRRRTSALTLALSTESSDGTEMVRCLLSMGADPKQIDLLEPDEAATAQENVSVAYWLKRAKNRPITEQRLEKLRVLELESLPRLEFAVVGQEAAVRYMLQRVQAFYCPPLRGKPLVLLALGPPGHGKTEFTRRLATAIASEDRLLEVSCGMLRDDADLFGARLGGQSDGKYASRGQLVEFLEKHEKERAVVLLDEFEKIKKLTSSLGWAQDRKIFQAFLEPWQEGVITDRGAGARAGKKIRVANKIFVLTSNLDQEDIVRFAKNNVERMMADPTKSDIDWVQDKLVKEELMPHLLKFFNSIDPVLQALASRIDCVVPFLPFTPEQQCVVADMELRHFFAKYRGPPMTDGPLEERRPIGHLLVEHKRSLSELGTRTYDPMQGARSMQRMASDVHGKLVEMHIDGELDELDPVEVHGQTFSKVYAFAKNDTVEISAEPPPPPPPPPVAPAPEQAAGEGAYPGDVSGDDPGRLDPKACPDPADNTGNRNTAEDRSAKQSFSRASFDKLPKF